MSAPDAAAALRAAIDASLVLGGPDEPDVAAVLRHLHDAGWAVRRRESVVSPVVLEGTTTAEGIHVRVERRPNPAGVTRDRWLVTVDGVEIAVTEHSALRDGGSQVWRLEGGATIRMHSPLRGGGPPTYNGVALS